MHRQLALHILKNEKVQFKHFDQENGVILWYLPLFQYFLVTFWTQAKPTATGKVRAKVNPCRIIEKQA